MSTTVVPSFSIVIANYNYDRFVSEAIDSALAQDYPEDRFDVIVIDDGSTDRSRDYIAAYRDHPRVKLVLQENRGQSAAFEAGVNLSRADFICLLDSDDQCLPTRLRQVAEHLRSNGGSPEDYFLCHDLHIRDDSTGSYLDDTWLQSMHADRYGAVLDPSDLNSLYPFANPSGEVFGRELIRTVLAALPPWAFPRGTDTPLCMAAMLKTWRVFYLHECLSIYRIHEHNESARISDGKYKVGVRWRDRMPRLLTFLERWVDSLDLDADARFKRISCLRTIERIGGVASPARKLREPKVTISLIGASSSLAAASLRSIENQRHGNVEVLNLASKDPDVEQVATGYDDFTSITNAYRSSNGEQIVFLRAGDRLDAEFVEQQLQWRRHGALASLSCCDVRLIDANDVLIHADLFANAGAWRERYQQIPPLATRLRDWVVSPLSACMLRRSVFLDALFDRAATMPTALREAGVWLLIQVQHHTAAALRIRETLCSYRVVDGAGATYGYLSTATRIDGSLIAPPVEEAVAWWSDWYRTDETLFRTWLPPAWHERFRRWLDEQNPKPG